MATQAKQKALSALTRRLEALIAQVEAASQQRESLLPKSGFAPTLNTVLSEYQDLAKRLQRRLQGNPQTLRRRLGTLKRTLNKRQRLQQWWSEREEGSAWSRNEAALLAGVLEVLVAALEVTLRPSLARPERRRKEAPASAVPPAAQQHTPACLAYQQQQECLAEQRAAWFVRWSRSCWACRGLGRVDESDPSVGLVGEWVPCEACTEKGICPRCGHKALIPDPAQESYTSPCLVCWFNFGEGQGHADDLPPPEGDGASCLCPQPPYQPPPMSEEEVKALLEHQQDHYDALWFEERNRAVLRRADR